MRDGGRETGGRRKGGSKWEVVRDGTRRGKEGKREGGREGGRERARGGGTDYARQAESVSGGREG